MVTHFPTPVASRKPSSLAHTYEALHIKCPKGVFFAFFSRLLKIIKISFFWKRERTSCSVTGLTELFSHKVHGAIVSLSNCFVGSSLWIVFVMKNLAYVLLFSRVTCWTNWLCATGDTFSGTEFFICQEMNKWFSFNNVDGVKKSCDVRQIAFLQSTWSCCLS